MRESEYTKPSHFWDYGDLKKIAAVSKLNYQTISNILGRHKTIGKENALLLTAASKVIGKPVPFNEWLFNASSTHPAFFNPVRKSDKLKKVMRIIKNMNK